MNTPENQKKFAEYEVLAKKEEAIYFGGRLGEYKYYDTDKTVIVALRLFEKMNGKIKS